MMGAPSLSSHQASMASSCCFPFAASVSRHNNSSSSNNSCSSSSSSSSVKIAASSLLPVHIHSSSSSSSSPSSLQSPSHSSSDVNEENLVQGSTAFVKRFLLVSSATVSLAISSSSAQASFLHGPGSFSSQVSHHNYMGNIRSAVPHFRFLISDESHQEPKGESAAGYSTFKDVSDAPPLKDSAACPDNVSSKEPSPRSEAMTNESIIQEAWLVVNERFLDARHNTWSQEAWLKKKEEVLRRPVSTRMAAYSAIRNMLSGLNDPYTRFLTPLELKQLSKYDITGVGLSLGDGGKDNKNSLRVVGVLLGSPAEMGGVKQGDELLSVNGVSVHGKSAFEASSLFQGPKGTLVTIMVRHNPCAEIQTLSLERQQSVKTPVYYQLEQRANERIGYIRLKEFNAVAKRDLVTAMNRLTGAGAASILLDLRDNPGGLVQAGIEVAKVFLDEGNTVIYTVAKDPQLQKQVSVDSSPLTKLPMMVLVNERTASASEIVAAALHDNCRAILVGHRTFGKGLIQSVFELSDGSGVILTVGKYVTPHHQDIDGNGILPDFTEVPSLVDLKKQIEMCATP